MTVTCLIAAHDPWFLQLIRAYSVECGLRVVQAYEMQDVLPLIHREHPAAVFLRTDLPGDNRDITLLHLLKEDSLAGAIPTLLFYPQVASIKPEIVALATIGVQEPVSFDAFQEALIRLGICPQASPANQSLLSDPVDPKRKKTIKKARSKRS